MNSPSFPTLAALGVLLVLASSRAAHAQTMGKTALIPCQVDSSTRTTRIADRVEVALNARRSFVISHHDALDRMQALSRPLRQPKADDADFIRQESVRALEYAAYGRSAAVKRSVDAILARADSAIETLNRDSGLARSILDACLALTRALLHKGDRSQALQQAILCRRLVPDVLPDERRHPAEVIGLLAEADDQLRRLRVGPLSVSVLPAASCSVYANGRHMGTTPLLLERMPPGAYRVEVVCGDERSRIHVVQLEYDKRSDIEVEMSLDQALATDTRVALRGPGSVSHATALGRALGADDIVLVQEAAGRFVLTRVKVGQDRVFGRAEVPAPAPTDIEMADALDALLEGRLQTGPAVVPEPLISSSPPPANAVVAPPQVAPTASVDIAVPSTLEHSSARLSLGVPLVAFGGALWAAGLAFDVRAHAISEELSDGAQRSEAQVDDLGHDYDTARALSWAGAAGGLLVASGIPWLVQPLESVPWWSWTLGGAGVALAGVGTWQVAATDDCAQYDEGVCIAVEDSAARGALLISAALALMSTPLTHFLKRSRLRADVTVSSGAAGLVLGTVRARY